MSKTTLLTKFMVFLLFQLASNPAFSQRSDRVSKYAMGVKMNIGHAFPHFTTKQDQWKAIFYPTNSLDIDFVYRFSQTWMIDAGLGMSSYFLVNKGPIDRYVLDFISPHISSGISYNFGYKKQEEHFVKCIVGAQLGYRGSFLDEFDTYSVAVSSQESFFYFIRPELGTRRFLKKKVMGSRYRMAYEFGTYARLHFNRLGTATITSDDFRVSLMPSGSHLGIYGRILFPVGSSRVRVKDVNEPAPIIYNPRNLK